MRIFKSIGQSKCVVCGTSKEGECALIGIDGTQDDGIEEALPIHLDCLELRYNQELSTIYMTRKMMADRHC